VINSNCFSKEGSYNINSPSDIEVPQWIDASLGKYYLYFAHHKGDFIRLANADKISGPWKILELGGLGLAESGFPASHVTELTIKQAIGLIEL